MNIKRQRLSPATVARIASSALWLSFLAGCGPRDGTELRAQATELQREGKLPGAVIALKDAIAISNDDAVTRYQLASVYLEIGDAPSAEKEIRLAMQHGLPVAVTSPVLARALLLQGQFQQAVDVTGTSRDAALVKLRGDGMLALGKPAQAVALYQSVLDTNPRYAPALVGMGRAASVSGDLLTARRFADRALTAAPRDIDSWLFDGDLMRAQGKLLEAQAAYNKVIAIQPWHRSAHVEKAYLEISQGNYAIAQADLDAARTITPSSVLVTYTQALLDLSQGKNEAARENIMKVLRVAPEHMPSLLLAGAVSLNLGTLHQAENYLRHYLEANPDNLRARKMLASTLLRSGHGPDALLVLAPALKNPQQDVQLLALAGETYLQSHDFSNAANYFEKASVIDPTAANLRTSLAMSRLGKGQQAQAVSDLVRATELDGKSQDAGMALVRTELGLQHLDKAWDAMRQLEKAQPSNAAVQDLKGIVLMARNQVTPARAAFRKAMTLDPAYFPACANLAQLELDDKHPAQARAELLSFLEKNHPGIDAMTALATLSNSEGKAADATTWLEKASAVNPAAIGPAVNLIAQYLLANKTDKALALARQLQVTHPDNPDLLDLLGKSQLSTGDMRGALATYSTLAAALPRSAQVQMQIAALQILLKNPAAAEDTLKTAIAIQPDFPAAQLALAELYARKGWTDIALIEAQRIQRKHPDASAGYQLEADILMGQNKPLLALPLFEKALAITPTAELVIKTANAQRNAGRRDDAARRVDTWLAKNSDNVRVRRFKADTLMTDGQPKLAALQIEATLAQDPSNPAALNNLALAYQMAKDPRAQKTAEDASRLAPGNPMILDTLGWILVDSGDAAQGVVALKKASVIAPAARDIRYHLAAGLKKTGDIEGARKELDTLIKGDMKFAQADDARALLASLK
ncbi:MAG: PEP-CTERM system TPR-repeat protein PrsT [Pseudomonadota bacterium]|nr:PEP-CTERM system TPR-repeat protein PrsT [Pseudomonadota bacterium]